MTVMYISHLGSGFNLATGLPIHTVDTPFPFLLHLSSNHDRISKHCSPFRRYQGLPECQSSVPKPDVHTSPTDHTTRPSSEMEALRDAGTDIFCFLSRL